MIRVEALRKRYGRVEALRGLDMRVPRGAVYGFVGPNGSGKTTTLRILAGLLLLDGGRAEVAGCDVLRDRRTLRRSVGYMPDFFGVYDDLRAGEYLEFYASAYGIRGAAAARRRDQALELVGLADRRESLVHHLSRGMQQRLCLARALIHDPEVLLLDEPASGLDPAARVEMRQLLRTLGTTGKTVLVSSHILSELADLCTYIGIIVGGRMIREDTVDGLLAGAAQRRMQLRTHGPADEAETLLRGWPGVASLTRAGGQLEFTLEGGAEDVARVLRALVEAGVGVVHFAATEHRLEDAFLDLVREEAGA